MTETEKEKKASLLADDLASLESYIHDLFTFSPLPLSFVSPIGVILEVNPSFEEISNLKSYQLVGEPIERLFDKETMKEIKEETFNKGLVKDLETAFFPEGQEKKIVQLSTKLRKDEKGDKVGYFMCIFDLTELKKKEEELKKEIKEIKEK